MSTSYFNNHSQSRFMPLSSSRDHSSNKSSSPSTTSTPAPTQSQTLSSKHFSSTLSSPSETKSLNGVALHPLHNTWVFWFRQQHAPGSKVLNYEEGIKKISSFSSVESFWSIWTHLNSPSQLQPTTDYLLFHSGVRRPVWEDPLNINGGKWIIRLRKGVADRLWEDLVLAVIGDQFRPLDGQGQDDQDGEPEICGCTISVRQSEDIISLWNRTGEQRVTSRTKETMKRLLGLPPTTIIEYKSNNDSLNDRSSFRNAVNTDLERDR